MKSKIKMLYLESDKLYQVRSKRLSRTVELPTYHRYTLRFQRHLRRTLTPLSSRRLHTLKNAEPKFTGGAFQTKKQECAGTALTVIA